MDISHGDSSTSLQLLEEEETGLVALSLVCCFMGHRDRRMERFFFFVFVSVFLFCFVS